MENWQLALTILSAILVGVLIPAIVQFQSTMRRLSQVVRANEGDVRRTLNQVAELSTHLNRLGSTIDANSKQIESFFETVRDVSHGIARLRKTVQTASIIGSALAPAVAAAIRAKHAQNQEVAKAAPENSARDEAAAAPTGRRDSKPANRRGQGLNGTSIEEEN